MSSFIPFLSAESEAQAIDALLADENRLAKVAKTCSPAKLAEIKSDGIKKATELRLIHKFTKSFTS